MDRYCDGQGDPDRVNDRGSHMETEYTSEAAEERAAAGPAEKTAVNYRRNLRQENDGEILKKIHRIQRGDPDYPPQFMNYPRMPQSFYVLGTLPDPEKKTVAIVGARGCSSYGKEQALLFGQRFAEAGVQVISGMAYGVDAFGQSGALNGGGRVYSVLGTGVDVCYPRQNYALYRRILREGGGIISEYEPGTWPDAWHFPVRNRLISALADVVLVVEAKSRSGSLITADYAMEQGKSIYAVPGRNGDALSSGCNRLISQGAGIAWTPEVILEELGFVCSEEAFMTDDDDEGDRESGRTAGNGDAVSKDRVNDGTSAFRGTGKNKSGRSHGLPEKWDHADDFRRIYGHLESTPKSVHMLISESGLDPSSAAGVLMQLCVSGYAEEAVPGYFRRKNG